MHIAICVVWVRLYAISRYLPTDILVCLPLRYIDIFIQSEAIRKQIILRKITLTFFFFFFFNKMCNKREAAALFKLCKMFYKYEDCRGRTVFFILLIKFR